MHQLIRLTGAFLTAISLCSCGGGGNAGPSNIPNASQPVVVPIAAATLVTTVPAHTYAAASYEASMINELNAVRGSCGFGLVKQSAQLDLAAADHANYTVNSNDPNKFGHNQTKGFTHFTGETPTDRAVYRGYAGTAGEVLGGVTTTSTRTFASEGAGYVRGMLSTPYHGIAMLSAYTDIGAAIHLRPIDNFLDPTTKAYMAPVSLGSTSVAAQQLAGDAIASYPCDGMKDVKPVFFYGERPAPFPETAYTLLTSGAYAGMKGRGASVIVKVRKGQILNVSSFALFDAKGNSVPGQLMTATNDANKMLTSDTVVFSPDKPLAENSEYNFRAVGTNNSLPFDKTVRFVTGKE